MRILVTNGETRAALAITRSLGSKGHQVYVTGRTDNSLAACSKYCHYSSNYPDPRTSRNEYIERLVEIVKAHRIDVILPVSDVCVLPIVENRAKFEDHAQLPLPSFESIKRAADKSEITQLAERIGVPVPAWIMVHDVDSAGDATTELTFPIVIKPSRSRVPLGDGWINTHVTYASSNEELVRKLRELPEPAFPVLLQERIYGPGVGLFYCMNRGEPIATFAHRRLREKPPSGGVSVLRESVTPHPVAREHGLQLLRELDWHGVAMVEFKIDLRDNEPKLMEINGRFWGSLQLAIDAGVDFPDVLVRTANGETIEPIREFRLGVRSRWLWGEIDVFLLYLLKSRIELNLPEDHDSRLLSMCKTLNPFVRNQKLEVLRLSDIRPWLYECKNWFRSR